MATWDHPSELVQRIAPPSLSLPLPPPPPPPPSSPLPNSSKRKNSSAFWVSYRICMSCMSLTPSHSLRA